MPFCPATVTLIDPLDFYGVGILSHAKDDSVVDFASAPVAALLSGQICILLLVMYFDKKSSVHLRIAITSAWKNFREDGQRTFFLLLSFGPQTLVQKLLLIPDPSVYQISTLVSAILLWHTQVFSSLY